LVIEGYNGTKDWFPLDDLLPTIEALEPGQVHLFSCSEEMKASSDLMALANRQHVCMYEESLARVLNRGEESGELRLGAPDLSDEQGHRISFEGKLLSVPRELWQNVSRTVTVVDDVVLEHCPVLSEDALYREFREALAKTDTRPDWRAYERNLFFTREFEARLVSEAKKRLAAKDLSETPIILHGPTGTGKTVALTRLAFSVRRDLTHPVIFIERKNQKPGLAEVEQFCRWLESQDAPACLIVWDGMLDSDEYLRAVRYLTSKGRKVVLVGSCYRLPTKYRSRTGYVEAPERLTAKESETFGSYLGRFHPELSKILSAAPETLGGTFLATLYRLLPPTRHAIRLGVTKELGSAEDLILKRASFASDPGAGFPTALAEALFKAGIVRPAEFLSSTSSSLAEKDFTNVQALTGLIMVPGQFGIRVPIELLMRALEYRHGLHLADLLKDVDVFQWYEDATGNIEIGPRNPLEARLVAQARLGGPASEVKFADRLLVEVREGALSADQEVDFAVKLVSALRGKEETASSYAPFLKEIADTLTSLREERGCENPRLMLQEANLLRKSVITSSLSSEIGNETRREPLDRAEKVLNTALDAIGDAPRWRDLRAFLLVELGALLATKASSFVQVSADRSRAMSCFRSMQEALRTARLLSQNSYYPIDVLAWATRNLLAAEALTPVERTEAIADLQYAFETAPRDEFDPEQLENFEKRRMEFANLTGLAEMEEKAFDALVAQGSAAGYYLRALRLSEPRLSAPDDGPWDENRLKEGLTYLKQHRPTIDSDSRCLDLLLDLWWMTKTKSRMFRGDRAAPPFSTEDWQYLLGLVEHLLALGQSSRPLILAYQRGLSLFHLRQYDRSFDVFKELERESDAIWGKKRIIRSYLASTEAGRPQVFHGEVRWLSPEGMRGEVYVEELMRSVKFFAKEFPKQDLRKGESLGEFHIGFNFLGPIADPKIYYKDR